MGDFLNKAVKPEDLALSLRDGAVSLKEVELNVAHINALLEPYGLVHVCEGYIGLIQINLPKLDRLLDTSLEIIIDELQVTLNPLKEVNLSNAQQLVNSVTEILARSINLDASADAEEFFNQEEEMLDNAAVAEFASKIDLMMSRMKVTFKNIAFRIESEQSNLATALEVRIEWMQFVDEMIDRQPDVITTEPKGSAGDLRKLLHIRDIKMYTDVFTPITSVSSMSMNSSGDESGNFLPPDLVGSMATSSLNYASCYTHVSDTKETRSNDKVHSNPIQFAHFCGDEHVVRIVCHNVSSGSGDETSQTPPPSASTSASTTNNPPAGAFGKKIEIDLLMGGTFYFMVTPSQLVLLIDLLSRLVPKSKPEADGMTVNERPMNIHQYEQLTNQLQNDNLYRTPQQRHWSANAFQEMSSASHSKSSSRSTLKNDLYQISLDNTPPHPGSSFPTGDMFRDDIDDAATTITETPTQRGSSASRADLTQKTPDVFSICIKTPNVYGIITHEDPMSQANINKMLQEKGPDAIKIVLDQLADEADEFFKKVGNIKMNGDLLNEQRHLFDNAYPKDHIRMMMQLADFRFTSESGTSQDMLDISSTFKRFDFTEYLTKESINGATKGQLFDIFNCSEASTGFVFRLKTLSTPEQETKCNVEVDVQPCRTEIDPSIIDRLSHLIVTKPFFQPTPIVQYEQSMYDGVTESQKFQVRFYCPNWEVDLRIPVADFSASSLPYNVRNVHPQYLKLEMSKLHLNIPNFRLEDIATFGRLDLRCSSIISTFVGDCADLDCQLSDRRFLYAEIPSQERPFLSISYDFRNKSLIDTDRVLDMNESISGSFCKVPDSVSPFTKKSDYFDSVKLVIPGNREELKEFASTCHDHSDVNFELFLTSVNLHLASKRFFEVIYNRFASDLALFTLKSPVFTAPSAALANDSQGELRFLAMNSDDDDYELDNRDYEDNSEPLISTKKSHKFSFDVAVDSARVLLGTVGGEGENEFKSQIGIELDLVKFFFVFGFHGDIDLAYCFFAAERNTILHRNLFPGVAPFPSDVTGHFLSRHQSDIFAEPLRNTDLCKTRDDHNLSVAVKIHTHIDPLTGKTLKDVGLAIAARNTTVFFRPFTDPAHFWAGQLSEFFNVKDEEIPNYEWPVVTINLDFHLGSVVLAYDHRNVVPENPMQLRIAIGTCDLSGSIVQSMTGFKFRCYLQETAVFLGKEGKKGVRFGDTRPKGLKSLVKFLGLEVLKFNFQYSAGLHDDDGQFISAPTIETMLRDGDLRAWVCHDTIFEFYKVLTEFMKSEYAAVFSSKEVEPAPSEADTVENPLTSQLLDTISSAMEDAYVPPPAPRPPMRRHDSCDEFGDQFDTTSDSNRSNDDEFVLVEDIPGCGITHPTSKVPQVRYLDDDYEVCHSYLTVPDVQEEDEVELPEGHPSPIVMHRVKNFSLHIFFYGGNDFGESQPTKPYSKWETERESPECKRDGSIGGPFRDHTVCVEMNINKINFNMQIFDPFAQILSLKILTIHNIELLDHCLVSDIKKLFFRLKEEGQPQRLFAPMLSLRIVEDQKREGKMKTSLLPIRLNVDQDTYEFLADFFTNVGANLAEIAEPEPAKEVIPPMCEIPGVPDGHIEVGSFTTSSALQKESALQDAMNTDLDADFGGLSSDLTRQLSMDDVPCSSAAPVGFVRRHSTYSGTSRTNLTKTFFKEFTFSPACKIKIDYIGKRVDVNHKSGAMFGIAQGVVTCNKAELILNELSNESGLVGHSKCAGYAMEQWVEGLKTQLPGVVVSLGPLTPFAGLIAGMRDLIYLPLTEFRREDGHVVQGFQRGASSFGLAAAVAAVDATQWLFSGFHTIAEFTYDVISPEYSATPRTRREVAERAAMPADLRQGVDMACNEFYRDMSRTAKTIKNATAGNHSGNTNVKSLIRAAPVIVGGPVVSIAKFTNMVLQGVKSQLNPDGFADDRNKYRR
uniref:Autophagy-related protein 2 n=1 Tax=Panagrellus redivivus TaxID=6233 RepID=A0A7E4ZQ31_PANRE